MVKKKTRAPKWNEYFDIANVVNPITGGTKVLDSPVQVWSVCACIIPDFGCSEHVT